MVERQEIDALLVGALYGELTPADEARLAQHLESHPTDRTVLEDLTRARAAVRDSRIFEVQLDPPQAVSALLLQEAARRAPRRADGADDAKPSWFARFLHSFVAHPAMAAATMLVLVVGVAGTMYLKRGDQMVEPTVQTQKPASNETVANAPAPALTPPATAAPAGEPVPLETAQDDQTGKDKLAKGAGNRQVGQGSAYSVDLDNSVARHRYADPKLKVDRTPAKPREGIVVNGREMQPKDLAENESKAQIARNDTAVAGGDALGGAGAAAPTTTPSPGFADATKRAPVRVEPKPDAKPAQPVTGAATPAPPPPSQVARGAEDKKLEQQRKESADDAWARDQLGKAIALAKAAKCTDAAKTALGISIRTPEFYAQNVADHRDLKSCRSYIDAEREKESERRAKSRPAKKAPAEVDQNTQ